MESIRKFIMKKLLVILISTLFCSISNSAEIPKWQAVEGAPSWFIDQNNITKSLPKIKVWIRDDFLERQFHLEFNCDDNTLTVLGEYWYKDGKLINSIVQTRNPIIIFPTSYGDIVQKLICQQ